MCKVKDEKYITIQGWMITRLQLSGNDLMVYAIIYGFSQDDGSVFNGSLQYLADWCSASKQGIQKNLKNLVERGLIYKDDYVDNGVKRCTYYANLKAIQQSCIGCTTELHTPIQLSCTNNIDNKTNNNSISKDIATNETSEEKPKKKNMYEKCLGAIDEYTDNEELKNTLVEYLGVRFANTDKPIRGFGMWKGLLKKLDTLKGDKVKIVLEATANGWASFYELNNYSGGNKKYIFGGDNNVFGETEKTLNNKKMTKKEREELMSGTQY